VQKQTPEDVKKMNADNNMFRLESEIVTVLKNIYDPEIPAIFMTSALFMISTSIATIMLISQ
jgi:hypothetical protein